MTLAEFFNIIGENPSYILLYFSIIPITALLAFVLGRGEGHLSPWKYLYSALIYLVCVPAIFAITLSVYLFLFERRSIMDTNVLTQILPILSMIVSLFLIKQNVSFNDIPGFDKISALVTIVTATFAFMWLLDKTRIYVVSIVPLWQAIIVFVGLFLMIRFAWSRFISSSK